MAKNKQYTGSPGAGDVRTWSAQIIPKETVVSGQAPTQPGATPMPGVGIGANVYAKTLYNMSLEERKVIAQSLKNAGYRVNTNGVYSTALVSAYTSAIMAAQLDAQQLGQTFNDTFFTNFLARETAARGAAGTGGPRVTEQKSVITDSDAKVLIEAIIRDKNQRAATPEEIERYTKIIQRKASKQPTITKTERVGGRTVITPVQSGFGLQEAQSFLVDRVAGTDEAKANKVLGYYETFMNALGGR